MTRHATGEPPMKEDEMDKHSMEHLDLRTRDAHGFVPDACIIGDVLTHTGNEKQYVITGFAWIGSTDEWGFTHQRAGEFSVTFVRPLSHLCGVRSTGEHRYQESASYCGYAVTT